LWDPESRYARSSYTEALPDPGTDLIGATRVCAQLPQSAIPYIIGSLLQLLQPPAWAITDPTRMSEILGQVTDLIVTLGTAGACMFRLTASCMLQYSLDGGTSWIDVTDWGTNFPTCVASNTPRIVMQPGEQDPPIPEVNADRTDYVYSPPFP
jgi:hypothetical protein